MPSLFLLSLEPFLYCPVWFLYLVITMSEDEEQSCVLVVTRLDCKDTYVSRPEAYEWATAIVRHICQSSGATWQGQLKAAIPLKSVINGFLFKIILIDVPEDMIQSVLIPGLEQRQCTVKRMEHRMAEADRKLAQIRVSEAKKRAHQLGDVETMASLIKDLKDMRGNGGPEAKSRKFGNDAMSALSISARACEAQLNQRKPDTE